MNEHCVIVKHGNLSKSTKLMNHGIKTPLNKIPLVGRLLF